MKKHLYQLSGFSLNFDHLVMQKCRVVFKMVALNISSFLSVFFFVGGGECKQSTSGVAGRGPAIDVSPDGSYCKTIDSCGRAWGVY